MANPSKCMNALYMLTRLRIVIFVHVSTYASVLMYIRVVGCVGLCVNLSAHNCAWKFAGVHIYFSLHVWLKEQKKKLPEM